MKRRKGLRPISERRQRYEEELDALKPVIVARGRHLCEVCRYGPIEHFHHRLRRSQGGPNELGNLVGCCLACHEYIHANPAQSYENGWMVRSRGLAKRSYTV